MTFGGGEESGGLGDGRVYVHQMKAPHLAEAYCDRVYEGSEGTGPQKAPLWRQRPDPASFQIYLQLVQVCPAPPRPGNPLPLARFARWGSHARTL